MKELVEQLKALITRNKEIDNMKNFQPALFHECMERIVPAPKLLCCLVSHVLDMSLDMPNAFQLDRSCKF
jgi:hypothetical protein